MIKGNIEQAVKIIEKYEHIVIFHHIRPDGDCLGSQFGLKELIQTNYPDKTVKAVGDKKDSFPFLEMNHDNISTEWFNDKKVLGIVVDANFKDRIESRQLLDDNLFDAVLRIDHHPNEDDLDAKAFFVDSSYIAAAEQVADIAYTAKWKVTPKAAGYLYLGIYTDSGRFLFKNTSARTYRLAGFLADAQADIFYINQNLTKVTLKDMKFQQYVYANYQTKDDVIYFVCSKEIQKELNRTSQECARVNMLANIENFRVWLFFIEEDDQKWRIEFRSNGPSVRTVAVKWGGGGHEMASGAIIEGKENIEKVVNDCSDQIKEFLVK
ncbi:DHH family phosphoesterase [Mycoplasma bradburyae]|uniref:Bifunctional oligoribonuclease/PAP phosphatase NrnA n=1 Tax=Mycoplasma bradburyae TaxID=2963128 RepID=A0AAW6HQH1_9MOLU|nr:bifunctional oligoribonuclease/PAP phosphatase NrnA [Mycoplasma bradburyae]MDC4183248.1 bifunctional oligoribonuclease/PAP phosphatase NrnA [Mycoplasma bradburyae]UTS70894.1 bifunctional oligoribonuclease/PAP phosphatase NrnA [Mycoplasma bradburyae]